FFGGALTSIESRGSLNIDNCLFSENECIYYGDAIYYESSFDYINSITNTIFKNHTTVNPLIQGDAIVYLNGNKIFNNSNKGTNLIYLYNYYNTNDIFIENNEMYNNTSTTTLFSINYNANIYFNNNIVARN